MAEARTLWVGIDWADGETSWVKTLFRKWERERAELDAAIAEMPPLALKTEGWTGYDVDALQPFEEES